MSLQQLLINYNRKFFDTTFIKNIKKLSLYLLFYHSFYKIFLKIALKQALINISLIKMQSFVAMKS